MPLTTTPPTWANVMGEYSTYPVSMAFDQQERVNRNNEILQQESLQDSLFKAQEQPLKLEELRARAGESSARQKAQETATKLSQQHIDEAIRSSGYKKINDMGAALEQFGTIAKQNGGSLPLQYLSMVPKDMLPLFDMPNGADIALQAGKAIRENSGAWQLLGSKQEAAQGLADTKAATAAETEAGRNARATAANVLKLKLAAEHNALAKSGSKDPTKWEALATKYVYIANDPNRSPEERDIARQNAINAANMQAYFVALAANTKNVGTTDVGRVSGLPTVQEKPMPNPTGPSKVKKDAQGRILLD